MTSSPVFPGHPLQPFGHLSRSRDLEDVGLNKLARERVSACSEFLRGSQGIEPCPPKFMPFWTQREPICARLIGEGHSDAARIENAPLP